MMEIFGKIGEIASQTYRYTTEKADKIARETKLKMKINENKAKIEMLYNEIGETVYRKHLAIEKEDFDAEIKRDCQEIDKISKEVEQQNIELLNLKDRKQCSNCHEKIEKNAKYCSNCGMEQTSAAENAAKEQETKTEEKNEQKNEHKAEEIVKENITEESNIAASKEETQENEKDICNNPIVVSATEEEKASNDENE